jgi:DNA-binding CsgD family transcriptional regulator
MTKVDEVLTAVFVDRETELRALHDAFATASSGNPQVLIIEGEAGIGKTTLIERFLSDLQETVALRAAGDESEAHVAFAIADQLLRSGGRRSDALRAEQYVAVGLELLELASSAPGEATSVIAIDDAHLADSESLRALLFATRRLVASRVLVILAVRGTAEDVLAEGWRKVSNVLAPGPLQTTDIVQLGAALGVTMTPEAAGRLRDHTRGNPLHIRAVLRELHEDLTWQYEQRPLPVPRSYVQLVAARLDRCDADTIRLIEAASVLGVRAPLHNVLELADVEHPLETLDSATDSGLLTFDAHVSGPSVEFSHPLTRVAIYEGMPASRRASMNLSAAGAAEDPVAAMRHRVEAATAGHDELVSELEAHARDEMARGAWSSAVSSLIAASRLATMRPDRERLALEAIEAMLYSGDGAAARRLAEQTGFSDGPRRDSVLAYLAMFAGDLAPAQKMLTRAWERRGLANDDQLAATIAQRSAFLSTSRLRGREAIDWVDRAAALAPDDPGTGLLLAPSLAIGMSFTGSRDKAHAALDRWLDDPSAAPRAAGFILLVLKGFLLMGEGDLAGARGAFERSAAQSLENGLLVVAALSLSGLTRVAYYAGEWDQAVVSAERAMPLAVESEDLWIVGQAHWSASYVPCARGQWTIADAHVRAIQAQTPTFERHVAAEAIAAAGFAAAQERPDDVLAALEPLESMEGADGIDDPAFLPWHHLKAHALVDAGRLEDAATFIDSTADLAVARANPLLAGRLAHARGKLHFARHDVESAAAALEDAQTTIEPLGMPYEQALIELSRGQVLRRSGERRAAAAALVDAHGRFSRLGAHPALQRCEHELSACGLAPSARKTRDYTALTPQELAVTRLVVLGMTNREVSDELMLSTKTVEFHLSNIYTKLAVRGRSELRARARANQLPL